MQTTLQYTIRLMTTEEEASSIRDFFLSRDSFDDQHYTPGEIEHFQYNPFVSLREPNYNFWYAVNEQNELIGACSVFENEQKTSGYNLDYIAVHKDYRKHGIASRLFDEMLDFVRLNGGRYVLAYTCDLPEYHSVQKLFIKRGFVGVGHVPDYYYIGEGRLTFLKRM